MVQNCSFWAEKDNLTTSFILIYWNCCQGPFNKLAPQIEPYSNSCQYPLINYLELELWFDCWLLLPSCRKWWLFDFGPGFESCSRFSRFCWLLKFGIISDAAAAAAAAGSSNICISSCRLRSSSALWMALDSQIAWSICEVKVWKKGRKNCSYFHIYFQSISATTKHRLY